MTRMRPFDLVVRGLSFYWRTHLAVVLGVATAVAVLTGALLVGDSVRGSLRALVLDRLGRTDDVVASTGLFGESLAERLRADPAFAPAFNGAVPLFSARGVVTNQDTGRRTGDVAIYGVDDQFWRFHGVSQRGPSARDAYVSEALAAQLQARNAHSLVVRLQRPTDVPLESLHGRKDDPGRTLRLTLAAVLPRASLGEFALAPTQGDVRAIFVPLSRLQQELEIDERVNTVLVSRRERESDASLSDLVRRQAVPEDLGVTLTSVDASRTIIVGSSAGLLDDQEAAAARKVAADLGLAAAPVFTYLANSLRIGNREVPYSLVSALDLPQLVPGASADDAIVLNEWAANDLRARVGDVLAMDYYVWEEPGRLVTRSTSFTVAGVVPLAAGGRDLAPAYPGITDSPSLDDWDPPFPIDLRRVRPVDEAYWKEHRTTPKAFIPIAAGQRLWASRYGSLTSLRLAVPEPATLPVTRARIENALRRSLDPLASRIVVRDVRQSGIDASRGATNFGEYFVYFSFFLVLSALLLASLFFKLGIEGRMREVGLLRAVGFGPAAVRRAFLTEGLFLSAAGSIAGAAAGVGYAALLMYALRTWWVDAVGTTSLELHVNPLSIVTGLIGGLVAAAVCVWWTLRGLAHVSERSLLAGELTDAAPPAAGWRRGTVRLLTLILCVLGGILLVAGAAGAVPPAGAFFGAGFLLMASALGAFVLFFRSRLRSSLAAAGWRALSGLGMRYASFRPSRSVLAIAVIASATFILISVDAFRRDPDAVVTDPRSGVGGYSVVVDTLVPIARDPNTPEGRDALNLVGLDPGVRIEPLRVRPGDDASCLNLYAPTNPRIVAPRDEFLREPRFAFSASAAVTDEERANPWLLLQKDPGDGSVPVIADANSMQYVLHKSIGDEIVIEQGGAPLRLRLVAALRDSIFQGDLVMAPSHFVRLFPGEEGYRRLLIETPPGRAAAVVELVEREMADSGADATTTWGKLAQFHRVENTYLSTFQTLGGLGLLLGTVGLGAVLLRNVLERRRELALLGAVGFRSGQVMVVILAENVFLLLAGLAIGAAAAGLAIAPAVAERGGRFPLTAGLTLLLFVVLAAGLLSSLVAIRAATRGPLLSSLRSE